MSWHVTSHRHTDAQTHTYFSTPKPLAFYSSGSFPSMHYLLRCSSFFFRRFLGVLLSVVERSHWFLPSPSLDISPPELKGCFSFFLLPTSLFCHPHQITLSARCRKLPPSFSLFFHGIASLYLFIVLFSPFLSLPFSLARLLFPLGPEAGFVLPTYLEAKCNNCTP